MVSRRLRLCWIAGLCWSAALGAGVNEPRPASFVYLDDWAPTILQELRYATAHNFVGTRIDGYECGRAILTRPAAVALQAVQAELGTEGLGLKVYDAYRPQRAVAHFMRWARDPDATFGQAEFFPEMPKSELFKRGYIALESGHSRGSTVDLTLVARAAEKAAWVELDMGSPYDFFGPISAGESAAITPQQQANRLKLRTVMERYGFVPYAPEWWHFTLRDEPFPDTYFDFPVN